MHSLISTPIRCPVLVGRSNSFSGLQRLLDAARGGHGQLALISGEAGVGKSRLMSEVIADATTKGYLALQGSCFEQDRSSPYAPLLDLLQAQFAQCRAPDYAADLEPTTRELLHLLPGILPPPRDLVVDTSIDRETHKRRLVTALAHHFGSLADRQPLLLVFEDLHWGDDGSLEQLLQLARLCTALPICLMATYRSDDAGPTLYHWIAQLDRARLAQEFQLERLTCNEVALMLRATFALNRPVRPEFLDAVYELTDGNPFFIEEVLTTLITQGDIFYGSSGWDRKPLPGMRIPRSVQDAVQRRLQRLSEPARQLLVLAAVIGRRVDLALLRTLAQIDELTLVQATTELTAAQLLVDETADQVTFRHALTRQAVYANLPARERRRLHRTVAEILDRQESTSESESAVADLAYHYFEAERWQKALTYSQRAGEQARMFQAPQAAVQHFTRALLAAEHVSPTPLQKLYASRAASYDLLGDFSAACADYATALALAELQQDKRARWEAMLALGALHTEVDYRQAGVYVMEALDLAREIGDPALLARSLNRVGNWHLNADRPELALDLHREALSAAEAAHDTRVLAETVDLLGMTCNILGDPRQSSAYYERAVRLFRTLDDRQGLVNSLVIQVLQSGSYWHESLIPSDLSPDDAVRAADEVLQLARAMEWPAGEAYVRYEMALWHGPRGEYNRAFDLARSALELAESIDHRQWIIGCHATLGALFLDLLAVSRAHHHLKQAESLAHELGSHLWTGLVSALLAHAYVQQRDFTAAAAALTETRASDIQMRTLGGRMLWCARAELKLAAGDAAEALHVVDQLIASDPNRAPDAVVPRLWRLRGEALAALRRRDEAEAVFLAARDTAHARGLRPELWRTHLSAAHLYRAEKRHAEARESFVAARRLLDELAVGIIDVSGRETFLDETRKLLPQPRSPSELRAAKQAYGGLTRREREVVQLIAEGRSNAEIAATLVLGRRTVETHISSILGKLGVTSRAQIVTWAVARGLVTVTP
jgi:DNA-binding CsgD family transcriptional regulator